jgi:class 3 adenylate cyclase
MNAVRDNPYYHRGPIKDAAHFYSRDRETAFTLQMVRNGQSVSVIGPRRIGKTSLLFHLSNPTERKAYGLEPEQSRFVYVDGQILAGLSNTSTLYTILEEIAAQLGKSFDISPAVDYRAFKRVIHEWSGAGPRLVLLIDEFEYVGTNPNLAEDFFVFLRSLTVSHNVAYITASQTPLASLISGRGQSNPFFNIFEPTNLGLFCENDARQMIRLPSKAAGVDFSRDTEDLILDLAGPHPFFLQIACYHAFELARNASRLDKPSRARLEQLVQEGLKSHFEFFMGRLRDEERRTLACLLEAEPGNASASVLRELELKCLIRRCEERYAFVSQAFAHFVRQHVGTAWAAAIAEGDRRMATVLFADVVGSTSLAEQRLPEEFRDIIGPAVRIFVDVADWHGGKIAHLGGDSVMALFGVPVEQPDDAIRAVRAALEIQAHIATFACELEKNKGLEFSARIGLNTGVVVLGELGGEQYSEYTALGDTVNLAKRLEELAEPGTVVISDHTLQQLHNQFRAKSLGMQQVKGKTDHVKVYQILEEKSEKH